MNTLNLPGSYEYAALTYQVRHLPGSTLGLPFMALQFSGRAIFLAIRSIEFTEE